MAEDLLRSPFSPRSPPRRSFFSALPGTARAVDPAPGLTRIDQTDEHIDYVGTWDTFEKSAAYMTAYARANTRAASATIYFDGTRLDWIAMTGTSTSKADVYLDGVFKKTVELAATSGHYKVNVWSTGDLPSGQHHVTITRSASATAGKFITLDAVDVAGTLVYGPPAITGLSPVSGSTAGGAEVSISGTDFIDASAVTFGGEAASELHRRVQHADHRRRAGACRGHRGRAGDHSGRLERRH